MLAEHGGLTIYLYVLYSWRYMSLNERKLRLNSQKFQPDIDGLGRDPILRPRSTMVAWDAESDIERGVGYII